jgi:hypothetical protein
VWFWDVNNDGDVEVFEQMGGAYPDDKYPNVLYENPGFDNQWICIKLVGTKSNRSAIGARIQVTVEEKGQSRLIFRHVDSGGSFGANPLRQTGLQELKFSGRQQTRLRFFRCPHASVYSDR